MKLTAAGILLSPDQLDDSGEINSDSKIILQKEVVNQQEANISKLQIENLELQNSQLKGRTRRDIILFIAGLFASLIVAFLSTIVGGIKTTSPQEIHLKIDMHKDQLDTTYVINPDPLK